MKITLKYSILLGNLSILFFLINYIWMDILYKYQPFGILELALIGVIVFISHREYINLFSPSTKQLIFWGLKIGFIGGLIAAIVFALYTKVLDPSYYANKIAYLTKKAAEEGLDENLVDRGVKIYLIGDKYYLPSIGFILRSSLKTLAFSLVFSGYLIKSMSKNNA